MDLLADYRIPFVGLKPGKHEFQLRVDPEFFACFPHSDVDQVHGEVLVELDKLDTTMTLRMTLAATMTAPCDRCLEDDSTTNALCHIPKDGKANRARESAAPTTR